MSWFQLGDGVPLWYEDRGEGPVVLLVPGWTFTTRFYEAQIDDLSKDHRVVALDLRGAGNSGKTSDGHTIAQYSLDVLELVDGLGLADVTMVGWAMGAAVGVHAIARDPSRFAGFVWCDHSPRFFLEPDWPYALDGDLTPWAWDERILAMQLDRPRETRELVRWCFHRAPSDERLHELTAELMKTPTEVMVQTGTLLANIDLRPLLHHLKLPVLLVNGRHSIVPCDVATWIERVVPTARSVVFESSGHLPYLEESERFNDEVRSFVART